MSSASCSLGSRQLKIEYAYLYHHAQRTREPVHMHDVMWLGRNRQREDRNKTRLTAKSVAWNNIQALACCTKPPILNPVLMMFRHGKGKTMSFVSPPTCLLSTVQPIASDGTGIWGIFPGAPSRLLFATVNGARSTMTLRACYLHTVVSSHRNRTVPCPKISDPRTLSAVCPFVCAAGRSKRTHHGDIRRSFLHASRCMRGDVQIERVAGHPVIKRQPFRSAKNQ